MAETRENKEEKKDKRKTGKKVCTKFGPKICSDFRPQSPVFLQFGGLYLKNSPFHKGAAARKCIDLHLDVNNEISIKQSREEGNRTLPTYGFEESSFKHRAQSVFCPSPSSGVKSSVSSFQFLFVLCQANSQSSLQKFLDLLTLVFFFGEKRT